MNMSEQMLFYLVFLGQVLLISHYLPKRLLKRMRCVFDAYKPSEYPRLYPKPIEHYERARRGFRNMNLIILLAGLLLLAVLIAYPRSGEWDTAIVTLYFMMQIFPMILVEIWSFRHYQLMRLNDSRTTRKAELNPRRLFDFVSPAKIGLAALVYIAFSALVLYFRQFDYPWFGGIWNIVGVTALNLFLGGMIYWNLYGKKADPYQANEDRARQMEIVVNQAVFVSIVATLFIAIDVILSSLDLHHLQPLIQSLFFQLMAVISFRAFPIEKINFEVYREDPLAT
jgi:hypothetical protein